MGCTSSSSVHNPSKNNQLIKDEPQSYQRQRSAASTSTLTYLKDSTISQTATNPPLSSNFIARHAFSPDGGVHVEKGAVLRLGERGRGEGYWCEVVTQKGDHTHIPYSYLARQGSLQCNDWFYENLSKYEAERKLAQPGIQVGTFIIHKKTQNSDYLCSALTDRGVSHYVVRYEDGGFFVTRRRIFSSVEVLVEVFMSDEKDIPFKLTAPFPPLPPIVYSRYEGVEYPIEVRSESVELVKKISEGSSTVWEGTFNGNSVAVRTFESEKVPIDQFTKSILRLRRIYHKNLQLVLGMCCQESSLFLVTEHFSRGSLKEYLVKEGSYLKEPELIQLSAQISNGMYYLEQIDYVHGLLAAHNVMIDRDGIPMICDAGTREFVARKERSVRWTALEVFEDYKNLCMKSDVWSFGMLLIEIITVGGDPFPNLLNSEVETQVLEGYQMARPAECHEYLYELMKECWNPNPGERPTFDSLTYRLEDFYITAEHESSPRQSVYRYVK